MIICTQISTTVYIQIFFRKAAWTLPRLIIEWTDLYIANYSKLCSLDCVRSLPTGSLVNVKMTGDLLFRWICELVLSPPVVALLDARVGPQGLDRLHVRLLERRYRLVVYVLYKLRVLLKYKKKWICEETLMQKVRWNYSIYCSHFT